jgi:hypothetical protein
VPQSKTLSQKNLKKINTSVKFGLITWEEPIAIGYGLSNQISTKGEKEKEKKEKEKRKEEVKVKEKEMEKRRRREEKRRRRRRRKRGKGEGEKGRKVKT